MIKEATNLDNLAQMYEGWTAWVWTRRRQTSLVQHSKQSTRINPVSGIHRCAKAGGDVYWGLICGNLGNPGAVGTGIPQERCTQSNVKHQWSATPRAQSTMLTVWVKWLSFCYGRSDSTSEKLLQKEIGILQTAWWSRTLFYVTLSTIEEMLNPVRQRGNTGAIKDLQWRGCCQFLGLLLLLGNTAGWVSQLSTEEARRWSMASEN